MNHAIQQKYLQTKVQTATPEQLLLMLVDGAIKFCKLGIEAIKKEDVTNANHYLLRTQNIVTELQVTLDPTAEIAEGLSRLYEYFNHRLIEANTTKKTEPAEEVLEHLMELKATWMEAAIALKKQRPVNAAAAATGAQYG